MTMPQVVRVFFAIDIPDSIKQVVGRNLGEIKKRAKHHLIRWTRPENLHITLQFVGEVQTDHLPQLISNVRNKLQGKFKPLTVHLQKLNLFPSPYRPRVIVLMLDDESGLAEISLALGEAVMQTDYEVEKRPFRAHLTLGRIKQPKGADFRFLSEIPLSEFEPIEIKEVILFRSEPHPEGSHYSVIERFELG